jgi:NitT/TauT family transport system permease protein
MKQLASTLPASRNVESESLARSPARAIAPKISASYGSSPADPRYLRSHRYAVRACALLLALAIWQLAAASKFNFVISFANVPTPVEVGRALWTQLNTQVFYLHMLVSVKRIFISFALAAMVGIAAGVAMGRLRWVEDLLLPHIEIMRPIPAVAWIPLAILMWPTEEASILFITFLGAFFPILLNTVHGVEQTPEVLVRAAQSLGAGRWAIFRHVVLPSALPSITTGLAVGMGVSWFSLLAGEIISGQYGIGYFTWASYTLVEYPKIIIGMLVIGVLGTASTALVRCATRPFLKWQANKC